MNNLSDDECRGLLTVLWERSVTGLALVAEDGSFLRANPSYCRLVEYTEAELRRRKFQDITDPEDVRADVDMAAETAAGRIVGYDMVKTYLTKTKRACPVLLRVTGLRINSRFIYFVAEVAALDRPPQAEKLPRRRFWPLVREYWTQILFFAGLLAAAAERVINKQP
jgi:two-component system sporulation sensor kinase A/two-component system, sporulation sensor kinase E